jgi:type I restriction enzyme, R subunit
VDKEFTAKTKELLREHTTGGELEPPGAIHNLGSEELEALKDGDASDTTKILNLRKILATVVTEEGAAKPFLLSIGERAEKLAQAYEDRQLTTQQTLFEFERLAQEYVKAHEERRRMEVDENTFAIYTTLNPMLQNLRIDKAREINALFERFPDFQWNEQQKGRLRTELYKALLPLLGKTKYLDATNTLIKLQRI